MIVLILPFEQNSKLDKLVFPVYEKIDHLIDRDHSNTTLKTPKDQLFAVRNIQMNMTKSDVEQQLGKPVDVRGSEYGTDWHIYHNQYHDFVMVLYLDNRVHGLYSNQNVITSKKDIKYHSPRDLVQKELGNPIDQIQKGRTIYHQDNDEYEIYDIDHIYHTVFYDKHESNQVTGLLQISHTLENHLNQQYAAPSSYLMKSYEHLDFQFVNAARVQKGLAPLSYSSTLTQTARKHSQDMAENGYFDHINLAGQSPFERMKNDGISYKVAAENLAYGQVSSIYAHHGLMNSLGHRKNILNKEVTSLGVGVEFNELRQPYWTENYTG